MDFESSFTSTKEPRAVLILSASLVLACLSTPLPSPSAASPATTSTTLSIVGRFDGSARITLTPQGASWEQVQRSPVGPVLVGALGWDPRVSARLANERQQPFLDPYADLASARLNVRHGRGTVALERSAQALTLFVCDSLPGSDLYELELEFERRDPAYEISILAQIDGADELRVSAAGASWTHRYWEWPAAVIVNGRHWLPRERAFLPNSGETAFLPADVDFESAELVSRSGRDLLAFDTDADGLVVRFADDPNGAGTYELRLRFRPRPRRAVRATETQTPSSSRASSMPGALRSASLAETRASAVR